MSFQSAITARFGLDTSAIKSGLNDATNAVKNATQQQSGHFNAFGNVALNSTAKVKRAVKSLGEDILAGAGPIQILTGALGKLSMLFKGGMSFAIGTTIAAMIGKECYDAWKDAQALNKELVDMGKPINIDFTSLDALRDRLAKVHEQVTKADTSINSTPGLLKAGVADTVVNVGKALWSPIDAARGKVQWTDTIGDLVGGRQKKREQEIALQSAIADKERSQVGFKYTGFYESSFKEQRDRADAKYREALGAAQERVRKKEITPEAGVKMVDTALAENRLEIDAIDKKEALEKNELELRKKVVAAHGDELKVINAKIDATNNDPRWKGNAEEIAAMQVQLQEQEAEKVKITEKIAAEKRELEVREQLAGFTGTASEKSLASLDAEIKLLEKRLATEKDINDQEKERIQNQINVGKANRPHLEIQAKQERLSLNEEWLDATTGDSYESRLATLREKVKQRKAYQASLYTNPGADEGTKAKAAKDVADIEKQIQLAERQHGDELANARLETQIMEAQLAGQKSIAQELAIEKNYREAINKALREGNTELANQLLKQQQLEISAANYARWKQTPAERQARREQERKDAKDKADFDAEKARVARDMDNGIAVGDTGRRGDAKRAVEGERKAARQKQLEEINKGQAELGQPAITEDQLPDDSKSHWWEQSHEWSAPEWKAPAWGADSIKSKIDASKSADSIQPQDPMQGIGNALKTALDSSTVLGTISSNIGINK